MCTQFSLVEIGQNIEPFTRKAKCVLRVFRFHIDGYEHFNVLGYSAFVLH
jgi:hypothetical protein